MRRELVCFDLDNTLFDHEAAFENAMISGYKILIKELRIHKPPSQEEWFQCFKQNSDRYWMWFEEGESTKVQYRRLRFRATMDAFKLPSSDEMADAFHGYYDRAILDFIEPYQGVTELFDFLIKKEVKIGVITNGMCDLQERKAEKLQLFHWISKSRLWISEQYQAPKPNRKMFDLARNSVQKLEQTPLFVGDSWKHDVLGSLRAGWDAVFLNSRNEKPATRDEVIAECRHFNEVQNVIMNEFA